MSDNKVSGHYDMFYKGIKMDPYRMMKICNITHPVAQHMFKKLARGDKKGHTESELVAELEDAVKRWKHMLLEDSEIKTLHMTGDGIKDLEGRQTTVVPPENTSGAIKTNSERYEAKVVGDMIVVTDNHLPIGTEKNPQFNPAG